MLRAYHCRILYNCLLSRFAPDISFVTYVGSQENRGKRRSEILETDNLKLIITSYEVDNIMSHVAGTVCVLSPVTFLFMWYIFSMSDALWRVVKYLFGPILIDTQIGHVSEVGAFARSG